MALYENGKIRFSDEFIEQFDDEGIRDYLKVLRYNLVDNVKSEYCTVEHMLYNNTVDEITDNAYWFLCGRNGMTDKNFATIFVRNIVIVDNLKKVLHEINDQICIENHWDK